MVYLLPSHLPNKLTYLNNLPLSKKFTRVVAKLRVRFRLTMAASAEAPHWPRWSSPGRGHRAECAEKAEPVDDDSSVAPVLLSIHGCFRGCLQTLWEIVAASKLAGPIYY